MHSVPKPDIFRDCLWAVVEKSALMTLWKANAMILATRGVSVA